MLRPILKLLPFFIVEYIAKKHCERLNIPRGFLKDCVMVVNPFKNVYISIDDES